VNSWINRLVFVKAYHLCCRHCTVRFKALPGQTLSRLHVSDVTEFVNNVCWLHDTLFVLLSWSNKRLIAETTDNLDARLLRLQVGVSLQANIELSLVSDTFWLLNYLLYLIIRQYFCGKCLKAVTFQYLPAGGMQLSLNVFVLYYCEWSHALLEPNSSHWLSIGHYPSIRRLISH